MSSKISLLFIYNLITRWYVDEYKINLGIYNNFIVAAGIVEKSIGENEQTSRTILK